MGDQKRKGGSVTTFFFMNASVVTICCNRSGLLDLHSFVRQQTEKTQSFISYIFICIQLWYHAQTKINTIQGRSPTELD